MAVYEVKDVVSDYGLYKDGELKLILSSKRNALLIKDILEKDSNCNYCRSDYYYQPEDAEKFFQKQCEKQLTKRHPVDTINMILNSNIKGYIAFRKSMNNIDCMAKCIVDDCSYLIELGRNDKVIEIFKACKNSFDNDFSFAIVKYFMRDKYYSTLMEFWNEN